MRIDLITSSFNSNIHWLDNMRGIDNIYLYEKSDNNIPPSDLNLITKKLINIGCEHQSYVQHIVDNYDDLADINIFTQADPFPHIATSKESFYNIVKAKNYYKFSSGYIDLTGGFLISDIYGRTSVKERFILNCKSFCSKFDITIPDYLFLFQTNGIFGATKNCIHSISRDKWRSINNYIKESCTVVNSNRGIDYLWVSDSVYIMERMWFNLLNRDNKLPENYKMNKNIHPYGYSRFI